MICPPCARAADRRLPPAAHCADPQCMCGHRPPREATQQEGRPA